jgi:hypothetical protein
MLAKSSLSAASATLKDRFPIKSLLGICPLFVCRQSNNIERRRRTLAVMKLYLD